MLAIFGGCTSTKSSLRNHDGTYLESVKLNYEAGLMAMDKENYDKAIAYFQFVRSKYPSSQLAALSDLKIADVKFAQKKWPDAASSYEIFIRLHPRNEEVPYASYRLGLSHYHAVPQAFFLLPDPIKRDQSGTKSAVDSLTQFIIQYPQSEYVTDAKEKLKGLFTNLSKHNQEIARYYERRKLYEAAIARHLLVEELYPETDESSESLYQAAMITKKHLNDHARAHEIFTYIIENKGPSSFMELARQQISSETAESEL
jgi:outer membrane protein assembly factor BamD